MFNVQKLSGWMNSDQSEFEKEKKIHIPSSNGHANQNKIYKNERNTTNKVDIEAEVDFVFNEEIKKLGKNKDMKF